MADSIKFNIIPFDSRYLRDLFLVFYSSVHSVGCAKHYDKAQREAWAQSEYDEKKWCDRIAPIAPYIVFCEGQVIAYGDIQADGYIDHFFVHGDFQGCGVGTALLGYLLERAKSTAKAQTVYSNVSLCAQALFTRFGFELIKRQQVKMRTAILENVFMELKLNEVRTRELGKLPGF